MEVTPLMTYSETHRRSQHVLVLWAGCGALLTAGLWMAASAAFSFTNHHVRVQPSMGLQTRTVMQGAPSRGDTTRRGPVLISAHDQVEQPSKLQAEGFDASSPGLLSFTAILVSLWAATLSLWRLIRPAPQAETPVVPVPAPSPVVQRQVVTASATERPTQMDEIAVALKADQESRKTLTPKQAILELQAGNARFWSGTPQRPELNAMERRALIIAQAPTVCILSCADSRVPVEIVFDQGLGSIFVVRVAGNILDATAMGSIEFSVKYLGVKAVLVMGHEACGAVKGAMTMSPADLQQQPAYLRQVLLTIKENLNVPQLSRMQDSRAQDREAVITNCTTQVKKLQQNELLAERIANGTLMVAGAFYEITSGIVDFFTLDKNGLVVDV